VLIFSIQRCTYLQWKRIFPFFTKASQQVVLLLLFFVFCFFHNILYYYKILYLCALFSASVFLQSIFKIQKFRIKELLVYFLFFVVPNNGRARIYSYTHFNEKLASSVNVYSGKIISDEVYYNKNVSCMNNPCTHICTHVWAANVPKFYYFLYFIFCFPTDTLLLYYF